jgi:hypothetical protein
MFKPTTAHHNILVWYHLFPRFQLHQLMLSGGLCAIAILDVDGPCCSQANLVMYRRVSKIGIVYPKLE